MKSDSRMRKNLREAPEFKQLINTIRELSSDASQIDYFPSPGNWGDSLINAGAAQLFSAWKLDVHSMPRNHMYEHDSADQRSRIALIGGGGGWNRNWSSTISFTNDAIERYRHTVVLPSSFDPQLIADLPRNNVTLISRASGPSASVADFECHDLAFYLQVTQTSSIDEIPYPLICLRRDKERNHASVSPDRNCDISLLGSAESSHLGFLSLIDRFGQIYTDRLHVAIAGAMLGKQVNLLEGNYKKNTGVHSLSLLNNYPNATLMEWQNIDWGTVVGATRIGESGY